METADDLLTELSAGWIRLAAAGRAPGGEHDLITGAQAGAEQHERREDRRVGQAPGLDELARASQFAPLRKGLVFDLQHGQADALEQPGQPTENWNRCPGGPTAGQ